MKLIVLSVLAATTAAAALFPYACGGDTPVEVTDASTRSDTSQPVVETDGAPVEDAEIDPGGWKPPVLPTTSKGCGKSQPTMSGKEFTTGAGRKFYVWGPKNYDANKAYPVALTFHGLYASGPTFQSWFKMEDYVKNDGFTVYPSTNGNGWDINGNSDLQLFDDMVKMLGEEFCINPSRVLGFGFSHGGIFMSVLGCKRAGYVKAIAVGDGSHGGNDVGCGRLPVLITHRTKDPDEKIAWAYTNRDRWAALNGCSKDTKSVNTELNCVAYQGCKAPGSLQFCEDTFFDPGWPAEWNHTVREPYRALTWQWFKDLP
ncbi:MAG: hypothetical protein U0174_03840 [Polyangiaceae bacterium]